MSSPRSLVSLADLSTAEILNLLALAERMAEAIGFEGGGARQPVDPLDRILATLFYEPSTRTRLSFESAMLRLGGQVLGFSDPSSSSAAKGETLADTARMISAYADIIVIRHPLAGTARVISQFADVPVINAGDGAREHPTQTLTDLFCIKRELGTLEKLKVGLCGDLKYGRTVHSLAPVMAQWDCDLVGIAPPALALPDEFIDKIRGTGGTYTATESLEDAIADLDVLYMTRIQRERFPSPEDYEQVKGVYVLTPEILARGKEGLRVLHPLPRVDEIDPGVDVDRRAAYFRQAAGGVPVRMALMALLLGLPCTRDSGGSAGFGKAHKAALSPLGEAPEPEPTVPGPPCANPKCVTSIETHLAPEWYERDAGLVCAYCERPA